MAEAPLLLEMRGICKDFSGIKALDHVSFGVRKGEIHALCGENGAGKSTLMKVLAGFYPAGDFSGEILMEGSPVAFSQIRDSERSGISIIYQELSLIQEMTVGENIFIGREPNHFGIVDWNKVYSETSKLLDLVGLKINPRHQVKFLGVGQQQLVEIAKALSQNPRILVLDEPTSALTQKEIRTLLDLLKRLREKGVSCVIISHKLDEVLELADEVTVLRDGKSITTFERAEATEAGIISKMVGRELKDFFPRGDRKIGETLIEVRGLSVTDPEVPGRLLVDQANFSVKRGEIVGISGLMGAGRTELLMALFGAAQGRVSGEILLEGKALKIRSPHDAIRAGIALVSEDRKRFGLVLDDTILKNMTLSSLPGFASLGVINRSRESQAGMTYRNSLRVKTSSLNLPVKSLSGGNQQKVVLAKCLLTKPKVLFLDEPTRGIDVGAKTEIYQLMNELAATGVAIVMVSSELPEILGMSDRVLVMSEGRIAAEMSRADASQEKIMKAATSSQAAHAKQEKFERSQEKKL